MTTMRSSTPTRLALAAAALLVSGSLFAQEAVIRKNLMERLPKLPKIDEIVKSPMPGVWEVRFGGSEILYSDDKGEHILVNGALIETQTRTDLTEARIQKLTAVSFDQLPVKDAFVIKQGTGARKMAVFVDTNCGYCKRFERDLATIKDVTIYTFLIPILGPDSVTKARNIWCADKQVDTWRNWMLDGQTPAATKGSCDMAAIDRNLDFARQYRINGTPAVFFADGTRKPGALPAKEIEQSLVAAAAAAAAAKK
ncbi:MAG: DsbC family protein [Rubrivivax sp.]